MNKIHNIGFLLTLEHSSFNAALGLAQYLQTRGHKVLFFVQKNSYFVKYVNQHGLKVIELDLLGDPLETKHCNKKNFRFWRQLTEHSPTFLERRDRLTEAIKNNSIDLCFLDDVRPDVNLASVVFAQNGVSSILLSYTFASEYRPEYPPIFSSSIPPDEEVPTWKYRFVNRLLWVWTICTTGHTTSFEPSEYIKDSLAKILDQIRDLTFTRELRELGIFSTWSEWKRRPKIPTLVFGHRSLDWPATASNDSRCYFGTTDLFRSNTDFDWSIVDPNKPIIFCNVSTNPRISSSRISNSQIDDRSVDLSKKKFRMANQYINVVLECLNKREDWQLIISCGPFYDTLKHGALPGNIYLFEHVPQIAVLKKADLAISFGGAGTVRECVNFGVPMLLLPAWTDQYGNAARIVQRNLGTRGDILKVSANQLIQMIQYLLSDRTIRASAVKLKMQCNWDSDINDVISFIGRKTGLLL